MKSKVCRICKENKALGKYSKNSSKKDNLQSRCKTCDKKASRRYYHANKDKCIKSIMSSRRKRVRNNQSKLFKFLLEHSCVDCRGNNPLVLEFDHLANKESSVSNLVKNGHTWTVILKEIEKCEIRCANCHRIKTAKDFNWYKYQLYERHLLEKQLK